MGTKKGFFRGTSWIIILVSSLAIMILGLSAGLAIFLRAYMDWGATAAFVGGFITFLSILAFLVSYILNNRETNRLAQREIYQRLELASIELFRFECENEPVVSLLWEYKEPDISGLIPHQHYSLRTYICQMLNLFEMAVRFRESGIMEREVFGSWVIWMYELANNSRFQKLWRNPGRKRNEEPDVRLNYVGLLRKIFDDGIKACRDNPSNEEKPDAGEIAFFTAVGDIFNCDIIRDWHKNSIAEANA